MVQGCVVSIVMTGLTAAAGDISGDARIHGRFGDSEIVIKTTSRLAGAIDSLTWNGKEFINSTDHGRQLQSAANFDAGSRFTSETFNPTEAGSRFDGAGPKSTSKLLSLKVTGNRLETRTRMAFWLRPGEKSSGHPAKNTVNLSNHILTKRVTIGARGLPNVIECVATFTVPEGEAHTYAQFEAVTGYMPAEFSKFWAYDVRTGKLVPLSDGPGEQHLPVILATPTGSHAMGVYSDDQPSKGFERAGYGRFRFERQKVVKWNCVFRIRDAESGIKAGDYRYTSYVVVGSLDDVARSLRVLCRASVDR